MATVCDYLKDDATKDALVKTKYMIMRKPALAKLLKQLVPYVDAGDVDGFVGLLKPQRAEIQKQLGKYADLFTLVVFDCQIDHLLEKHAEMKIPQKITRDTLSDFRIWTQRYKKEHGGACGFTGTEWMILHMSNHLYRIGRLQYRILDFPSDCEVYRNRETGQTLAVLRDGVFLTEDGFKTSEDKQAITTTYINDGKILRAHTIEDMTGRASLAPETIDLSGYVPLLMPGDKLIDMHIPEDGPMDFQKAQESMRDALAFFRKYYPQYQYKAYYCYSWLLCNELREFMRQDCNILRFAGQFTRLLSGTGTHPFVYQWIFGFDHQMENFGEETPKTSLQKGAIQLLSEGRWFTEGSGFKLIETTA